MMPHLLIMDDACSLLQAGGSAVPKLLKSCGPAVAAAVTAAVLGPFAKPQRHLEAVAAACQVLESAEAAQIVHGKGGWHEARQATEQALGDASSSPKLAAALQRLEALLAEAPVGQGKRGKLPAGRAASAKKQKQSA